MKPILLNTDMVRAILEDRKTVTRRVVKIPHCGYFEHDPPLGIVPPCRPGDILYVRETWCQFDADHVINGVKYAYKADSTPESERVRKDFGYKWCPSIHMPREATRIFLRVTDVKVQRVQDITDAEARKEGCKDRDDFHRVWNNCYSKPQPVKVKGVIDHYESYPWEDIQETRTYRGKPWYVIGNPWTWGIEFERCEKPEGD